MTRGLKPTSLLVFLALMLLAGAPSALADDETSRERIFLVFGGDDSDALEQEAKKFQAPVLGASRFEFAGTKEMEEIYAACTEDIGTNAEARRDCQLRAANRIMVTQILELGGSKLDSKQWDVGLEVWSPESNGLLYVDTVTVEAKSLRLAAREAFPTLANGYLCWRGLESACATSAPAATTTATTTTTTTTPAPVDAMVGQAKNTDTSPVATSAAETAPVEQLSKAELQNTIRGQQGLLKKCADFDGTGKVTVTFTIAPSGSVSGVSTREATEQAECVALIFRKLKFPAHQGEPMAVTLPVKLGN